MKKLFIILFAFAFGFNNQAKADEGMWIPLLINNNIIDMQKMGCKLSAEDIYSVNHSSLKDAIIIFGRGCTGEIVSSQGLIFTNHHCGYSSIQKVSTPEHNYLDDGFWATSKEEEIPVDGLTVKFLIRMEDVTGQVLTGVRGGNSDEENNTLIKDNIKGLIAQATKDNGYNAIVETMFAGNEYYLFVYETYTDIRLVGTPPESIGKFGADTDNWMWPRHTGDFSIFRVYTTPEGKPADYSPDNIPLKPKKYLPISISGYKEGDFAMIMGNPGSTERYLSSYGVKLALDQTNMTIVDIRAEKLRIMQEGMDANEAVRLQYASKYASTANYWKYFIGQTKGLKRLRVLEKKQAEETAFTDWLNNNPQEKVKFGEALPLLEEAYDGLEQYNLAYWYYREAIRRGAEILTYAKTFGELEKLLANKETPVVDINKEIEKRKEHIDSHFKDYNVGIDKNLFASMMKMYHQHVPLDQQPVYLLEMDQKFKSDYQAFADYVFDKSIFDNPDKVRAFLNDPKYKKLEKDPALIAMNDFADAYQKIRNDAKEAQKERAKGEKLYIAGLREMHPDKNYYPDANFTMRLSYGTVQGYSPADAVYYNYFTTLKGVIEKEDPGSWEFTVPEKLKEIYRTKDFGPYGNDTIMHVNFLTNNDITGGNSGSPVINGKGELIGLAFDGNWEAMSGDIAFETELQRTINVDIRYVLLIIDKFAGAKNIIDELTLVKDTPIIKDYAGPSKTKIPVGAKTN
jgi:hypothetical protein